MTRRDRTKPLSAVIGAGLAAWRAQQGLRQEDVAFNARHVGLTWTRATVASVELGRRELTATELLLLPVALEEAAAVESAPLWELVDENAKVTVSAGTWLSGRHVRYLLGGPNPQQEWLIGEPTADLPTEAETKAAGRLGVAPETVVRRGRARWGHRLDDEREQRLGDTSGVPARTVQARRGHITRQLIAELQAGSAKAKDKS
ncbi:MAG: hypothetical protein ACR2JO_00655 [Mycobacteriales bacterium]